MPGQPRGLQRIASSSRARARICTPRLGRHRGSSRARSPRASVTGLSPTSTILTRPARVDVRQLPVHPLSSATLALFSLRQEERQALERHGQIDASSASRPAGSSRRARRESSGLALMPAATTRLRTFCAARRGHGDDRDVGCRRASRDLLQIVDVVNRHAAPRLLADLLAQRCRTAPRSRSPPGGTRDSRRARGPDCPRP